jgi:hypothetical protein
MDSPCAVLYSNKKGMITLNYVKNFVSNANSDRKNEEINIRLSDFHD